MKRGNSLMKLLSARVGVSALMVAASVTLAGCGGSNVEMETPPPQMRLISESQYKHSIADIFGDDVKVVGWFEEAPEVGGLAAIGASEMSVSSSGFERYYALASTISEQMVSEERWARMMPCDWVAEGAYDATCANDGLSLVAERLLRRSLSDDQHARWIAEIEASTEKLGSFPKAVGLAIEGLLSSPEFLFIIDETEPAPKGEGVRLSASAKAHRMSFFLWNTVPDEELLATVRDGSLHDKKILKAQAARMLASDRLEAGVEAFFEDFLDLNEFELLEKDKVIYPAFNKQASVDAKEQMLRFLKLQLIEKEVSYPEIFTAKDTVISRPLGMLYRVPVSSPDGWEPFEFAEDDPRAGLLSHAGFTALHSHPGRSSATLRGIAVRELLLCQTVEPAPAAVNFTVVQDTENPEFRTARERLTQHRTDDACKSCHEFIDPVGLALENFDGVGTFRDDENGAPIDTSGMLDGYLFETLPEMQQSLAQHPGVGACLVEKVQKYALGRAPQGGEVAWRNRLEKNFTKKGQQLPSLLKAVVLSDEFFAVGDPHTDTSTQEASVATEGGKS